MIIRRLKIKWQVFRGMAIDIWSKDPYPSNVLSNLCSNGFKFDGMLCGSMEGFLQSLKYKDEERQRQICAMKGGEAKKHSTTAWQKDQILWWQGKEIDRQGDEFQKLIFRAYKTMADQNTTFRTALISTDAKTLYHSKGCENPYKTILTEEEFCEILTKVRNKLQKKE